MKRLASLPICLAIVLFHCSSGVGGEPKTGFLPRVHKGAEEESKYALFVPHTHKETEAAPLILFLHGGGERGDDGELPVKQGIGNAIKFKQNEKTFPFFVIFPQCKAGKEHDWKACGPDAQRAMAILDEVMKEYRIDAKRLYLTGLSMGGVGTWSLAAAHPGKWAAIAPICGRADLETATAIKDIPCWTFCGDQDNAKLLDGTRDMVAALKKAGGNPRYSEFPYVGHNSWDSAYVTPELYPWFLSHKLK
jgi:predicted peptidase